MHKGTWFGGTNILLQGLISEDKVKDCNSRLFMVRMKLGEFDPPEMNPYTQYVASWHIQQL
jgi:hypothetical protein